MKSNPIHFWGVLVDGSSIVSGSASTGQWLYSFFHAASLIFLRHCMSALFLSLLVHAQPILLPGAAGVSPTREDSLAFVMMLNYLPTPLPR